MTPLDKTKAEVRGRESEVLAALNISCMGRKPIRCPFPDHADHNPSWRWDEDKKVAFCSCKPDGSYSIFDVTMK